MSHVHLSLFLSHRVFDLGEIKVHSLQIIALLSRLNASVVQVLDNLVLSPGVLDSNLLNYSELH